MTVKELKDFLNNIPDDYDVAIYNAFEGGTTYNFELEVIDGMKQIDINC